ncbi:hypothetical protein M446_2030 [Methylobacterium sp. 4-46]|uniref:prepilin-type N-terminal cleavage/methylation domain-containing protein n=1 Tax=unclassified Methylobacterium TaxID=2615210 RepID=UPI000152E533|nr:MULTISPECIES: prepilin-type N-terminal cleavage/methylation domain-containing protein [Methylobacterium]ACA16494.1 hypothetical protein M446_2030 [Methylobacterium sp. 4-46]WFT82204.1 prepilin-type N-terminal cleavage/methylation domain-containing protein [Methylobacterium nodulans]
MAAERRARGGFSLVEVLASLAVAGAVLAALASAVALLTRQAERVAAGAEARERAGRSLATLARAVEGAARARWDAPRRGFVFAGTRDTLVFAAQRREGAALRIVVVRAESVPAPEGGALLWREGAFVPSLRDLDAVAFGEARRLSTGGARLRFAYVTPGTPRLPELLTDEWPAEDALPEAVRLALTDPASGEIRGSLRVPLRAAAEPGCLSPRKALCSRFDERKAPEDDAPSVASILGALPYQVRR